MEIKITVNVSGVDPIEIKVEVPDEKCFAIEDARPVTPIGKYAVFFDETSPTWHKCAELNKLFLIQQQEAANFRLKKQGYLFLNEVYEMLGLPKTRVGQCVGWVRNDDHRGYVDFGMFNEINVDFVNGRQNIVLLDFNVDGVILQYL